MTIRKVNFMWSKIFELEFRFSLLHNSQFEHPKRQYGDTTKDGQTLSGVSLRKKTRSSRLTQAFQNTQILLEYVQNISKII